MLIPDGQQVFPIVASTLKQLGLIAAASSANLISSAGPEDGEMVPERTSSECRNTTGEGKGPNNSGSMLHGGILEASMMIDGAAHTHTLSARPRAQREHTPWRKENRDLGDGGGLFCHGVFILMQELTDETNRKEKKKERERGRNPP